MNTTVQYRAVDKGVVPYAVLEVPAAKKEVAVVRMNISVQSTTSTAASISLFVFMTVW